MFVKKVGKIVLGAELTKDERKALDIEIHKEFAEINRKNSNEIDAILLWWLHEKLGFGYDRLKQFYFEFAPNLRALCERYEMNEAGDDIWLCTKKLKDYGIDIEEWAKEVLANEQ